MVVLTGRQKWPVAQCDLMWPEDPSTRPLCVAYFQQKGRGVVATQTIPKNKFVFKYAGRLMTAMEGQQWEAEMEAEGNPISFLLFH